jgi:hypothetical protein
MIVCFIPTADQDWRSSAPASERVAMILHLSHHWRETHPDQASLQPSDSLRLAAPLRQLLVACLRAGTLDQDQVARHLAIPLAAAPLVVADLCQSGLLVALAPPDLLAPPAVADLLAPQTRYRANVQVRGW